MVTSTATSTTPLTITPLALPVTPAASAGLGRSVVDKTSVDDWIKWYESKDISTSIDKKGQEELFIAFNLSISKEDCKKKLIDHQESLFLFKEIFGNKLNMFHHVRVEGGTVYDSTVHTSFMQGVDKEFATPMTPDTDILFEKPAGAAIPVPTITNILQVTTKDEVNALTDGATTVYKPRNFIPVTPFLCQDVNDAIEESDGDCGIALMKVVQAIKMFDTKHADNIFYLDKAKQKCKDLLCWLYLASQNNPSIKPIPTSISSNRRIREIYKSLVSSCLTTASMDSRLGFDEAILSDRLGNHLKRPLEMIATSNETNIDILRSMQAHSVKLAETASKSFSKIPEKYQNILMVASSQGEVTAMELNEEAKEFFKCSNLLNASIMLNSVLEAEGIDCSVPNSMVTALVHGSFLWVNAVTPSNFCIFSSDF